MTPPATIAARHPARTKTRNPTRRPPRRISGPSRPKRDPHATAGTAAARPPVAMRLGARAMRVGDARVLDRLVRGRAWIALMAIGLMGIVFMQVSLLKLNAGISRAVTAADTFDRQNSSLREDISNLGSGERIQDVAAKLGMVTPAAGDVHYLDARGADGARAAAAIKPPKPVTPSAAPALAATTAPTAATTTTPPASTAAATGSTPAATTAAANTAPATTAPATTAPANSAAAPTNTAPANTAPATTAPANTAPANTAPANTAPTATGPPAVAGGASAPTGQG